MNYADIKYFDVINGEGVRVSIFVSGCSHKCEHCFNPSTWNPKYGDEFDEETQNHVFEYIKRLDMTIKGISFLGGDPTFEGNIEPLKAFINKFKKEFPNKNIWMWSGFTFEEIIANAKLLTLVRLVDVLVDGTFNQGLKDLKLKYRGSSNQRVIDVKKSLKNGEVVLYCE